MTQPCTESASQPEPARTRSSRSAMSLSQITPTLFVSGADAPFNAALVSQKGITLIVNATVSHASPAYPGVECVRVPVVDLPGARLGDHFDRVAERIHYNRAGGTLVHCAAGMSRSPALVMAYLMRYRGVTLRQAHRWVQESRPYVRLNAGFWDQLLQYEKRLYGKNTIRVAAVQEAPRVTRTTSWLTQVPRSPLMSRSQVMMRSPLMSPSQVMMRSAPMSRSQVMMRSAPMSRSQVMMRSPLMSPSQVMMRSAPMSPSQVMMPENKSRRRTTSSSIQR